MARGAEIAARHRAQNAPEYDRRDREHTIRRLCLSRKMFTKGRGADVVAFVDDIEVAVERLGPAWPSEVFVANCMLAVAALKGTAGIPDYAPDYERKRRDEQRSYVTNWSKVK
jgi:hypothetical protein